MKMLRPILALALLIICAISASSQIDSAQGKVQDSILQATTEQGKELLLKADSASRADSLAVIQLEEELESLRGRNKRKKAQLQARLDSIKNADSIRNVAIQRQVDSLKSNTEGVPVVFYTDTLFSIYAKLGPFTPSDRAFSFLNKLDKIADQGFNPEKLKVIEGAETSDIFYNKIILLSVTDRDAFWAEKERDELANEYRSIIELSVEKYLRENGLMINLGRAGLILLVIGVLILIIRVLNGLFSKLIVYFVRKGTRNLTSIKIRNYEFLTYDRLVQVVTFVLNTIKWIIILFILYASLPLIFGIFPTTEDIAWRLIGYVVDPLSAMVTGVINYIPELITIIVIVVVTRYFVKALRFLSREVEQEKLKIPGFYPDWARPTFNLLSFLIHAFAFVVIFPYLPGSDSPIFQGVSVFLGLLISLGSSSAIGNIIAGLVITYMRPFRVGERVKIGETVGDVIEKTMLNTRLRTLKNEIVTIPNLSILNGQTFNYSTSAQERGLILHTSITIGYDVHWTKVRDCLIEAALKTEHIEERPAPFVLQTSLDDFYVSYQINAFTRKSQITASIYSQLHANILDVFHENDIEIMSPHFRAERDGSTANIPLENQKKTPGKPQP